MNINPFHGWKPCDLTTFCEGPRLKGIMFSIPTLGTKLSAHEPLQTHSVSQPQWQTKALG
jgi:hypothetical protein